MRIFVVCEHNITIANIGRNPIVARHKTGMRQKETDLMNIAGKKDVIPNGIENRDQTALIIMDLDTQAKVGR